jgi:hypothetical protein
MGLGSEIRDPERNLSRIRVQGQKGTGSRIRNTNFKYISALCLPEGSVTTFDTDVVQQYGQTSIFTNKK